MAHKTAHFCDEKPPCNLSNDIDLQEYKTPYPDGQPPPYLPQAEDKFAENPPGSSQMGPVGPWATGRVDWSPLGGLTGCRPVVDRYSITRFSPLEWRQTNQDTIDLCRYCGSRFCKSQHNAQCCMKNTVADSDKDQLDNTHRLQLRTQDIFCRRFDLERLIYQMREEIQAMTDQRHRLKLSMKILALPESICRECIQLRTARLEPDLVRDEVEEELISERALCREVRDLMERTLAEIESQLLSDKVAKVRLENDWSEKTDAYGIEAINCGLKNSSPTILFKPGATRFPADQSSPEHWQHFTRENIAMALAVLRKSEELRKMLDGPVLSDSIRDLRKQADKVTMALQRRIAEMDQCRQHLEIELKLILRKIADTEDLIARLEHLIRQLDYNLKCAQTRLDNRLKRPRVENCRDIPQYGLVEEIKHLGESVAALKVQIADAEDTLVNLNKARAELERQITIKRKSLVIDAERCMAARAKYPDTTLLAGH